MTFSNARSNAPVTALFRDEEFDQGKLPPQRAQELVLRYTNEVTAFDVGFRICRYFETKRTDTPRNLVLAMSATGQRQLATEQSSREFVKSVSRQTLTYEYIETIGSFLKTKNVSPHGMYLIYKSLFFPLILFEEDWRGSSSLAK